MAVQRFSIRGLTAETEKVAEDRLTSIPGVLFASVSRAGFADVDFDDDRVTTHEMCRALSELGLDMHLAG